MSGRLFVFARIFEQRKTITINLSFIYICDL